MSDDANRRLRVLVADDQRSEVDRAVDALRDLGHLVVVAEHWPEALEGAQRSDLDLAIIDLGWMTDAYFDNPNGRDARTAGYDLDDLVHRHSPQAARVLYTTRTRDRGDNIVAEAARRGMLLVKKYEAGSQEHLASVACYLAEQLKAARQVQGLKEEASRLRRVLLVVASGVVLALTTAGICYFLTGSTAASIALLTVVSALAVTLAVVVLTATRDLSAESTQSFLEVVKAFLGRSDGAQPPT